MKLPRIETLICMYSTEKKEERHAPTVPLQLCPTALSSETAEKKKED